MPSAIAQSKPAEMLRKNLKRNVDSRHAKNMAKMKQFCKKDKVKNPL